MKCPFLYVCTHACYDERKICMFKTIVFFLVFKTTTSIYWKHINIGISISFFVFCSVHFRNVSVLLSLATFFHIYSVSFMCVRQQAWNWLLYGFISVPINKCPNETKNKNTRAETLKRATKQINSEQPAKPYT